MYRTTKRSFALAAVLSAAVAIAGCSGKSSSAQNAQSGKAGIAKVSAALDLATGVDHVTLTITYGSPAVTLSTHPLNKVDDTHYSATVTALPVANNPYTFTLQGFDAGDAVVLSGVATNVIISSSTAAQVNILMHEPTPPTGPTARLPVLDALSASAAQVTPGTVVNVSVTAHSPESHTLVYLWSDNCNGTLADAAATATTWTAPAQDSTCQLSVRISDATNATSVTGYLVIVVQQVAQVGDATVQATVDTYPTLSIGVIDEFVVFQTPVPANLSIGITADIAATGQDPDGQVVTFLWSANCGSSTGTSTFTPPTTGNTTFRHSNPNAACTLTLVVSDESTQNITGTIELTGFRCANVTCNVGEACDSADGVCKTVDACAGVTCTASNLCKVAGTCNSATGQCSPETDKPCGINEVCDLADGLCKTVDACAGVTCTASDLCHVPGTCDPASGQCSPETPVSCQAGQTCDLADGVCKGSANTAIVPKLAKFLNLERVDGLASSGNASYLSATANFLPAKDVDGASVAGAGASDVYLSRYDMTTGAPAWRKAFGDELDQFGKDSSAPTADGTVAVIGRWVASSRLGECVPGTPATCSGVVASNPASFTSDFLLLADAATGNMKAGTRGINNGSSGQLNAVDVNPGLDLIAVCGTVNAPSELSPTTPYQGGLSDLLVAVFNSAGTLQWARQLGSSTGVGDESCNAVAVANDGSVYAVGKYMDELDFGNGTGALPSLLSNSAVRHMWVAHFAANGDTMAATAFGTPAGRCAGNPATSCTVATAATDCAGLTPATCNANPAGNVTPADLEIDAAGNLVVSGAFTVNFPVGSLVTAGGTDAFVAKLSPAFVPAWGVRLGNTGSDSASSVVFDANDNVVAVGNYTGVANGSATTGAAALTAPGTSNNVFTLKLDAATGATHDAKGYGDADAQSATEVAISGNRIQLAGGMAGVLDFGAPTTAISTGASVLSFTTFADLE
jgi:hypothetical protein